MADNDGRTTYFVTDIDGQWFVAVAEGGYWTKEAALKAAREASHIHAMKGGSYDLVEQNLNPEKPQEWNLLSSMTQEIGEMPRRIEVRRPGGHPDNH